MKHVTCFLMAVFFISSIAHSKNIGELDRTLSHLLEGDNKHPVRGLFFESTSLITPIIEFGSAFDLYRKGYPNEAGVLTASLLTTQLTTGLLKYTIKRKRPKRFYKPQLWNTRLTPSFPSGHTSSSAVYAAVMGRFYPDYASAFLGLSLLSGLSQVYVGNHYLSDVIAGWTLGYITGILAYTMGTDRHQSSKIPLIPTAKITLVF